MKLGICAPYNKAGMAKNSGFDYFEYNCADLFRLNDKEFTEAYNIVNDLQFYSEAMCMMLVPEIKVTGFQINMEKDVKPYLDVVLPRAHQLGCKKIVFGSSRSRNMPENFWDRRLAYQQIVDYIRFAASMMEAYGMELVIEPCPNPDNNILNFVSEGHYVMRLVDRPNVRLLADTYLMQANYESLWEIYSYRTALGHLHMSSPDRFFPYEGDGYNYNEFFDVIKNSGYDGTITIEAHHPENNCEERMKMANWFMRKGLGLALTE